MLHGAGRQLRDLQKREISQETLCRRAPKPLPNGMRGCGQDKGPYMWLVLAAVQPRDLE